MLQPVVVTPTCSIMRRFTSFACIDWSGAAAERPAGIRLAKAAAGAAPQLLRPDERWSRAEILAWMRQCAAGREDILIGMDVSAGFPFQDFGAYFPGVDDAPANARGLWALVEHLSRDEPHLAATSFADTPQFAPYFRRHGGRTGAMFGQGEGRLRVVERHQRATRQARSASNFNLVGAGQVGKASLSAMRLFHRLEGIIPIWPFDPVPASGPMIVELYTSVAARAAGIPAHRSKIRDAATLRSALARLNVPACDEGALDDHATDALVTAAWLSAASQQEALWHPPLLTSDIAATEGWTFGII